MDSNVHDSNGWTNLTSPMTFGHVKEAGCIMLAIELRLVCDVGSIVQLPPPPHLFIHSNPTPILLLPIHIN